MAEHMLKLESNVNIIYNLISSIQKELSTVVENFNQIMLKALSSENQNLEKQVETARKQLMELQSNAQLLSNLGSSSDDSKGEKKSEKPAKAKPAKTAAPANKSAEESPVDIGRLDFRVGKIIEASKHPDADSLYVEKIELGQEAPRTVVSGLVKFVPIEQMQNRMVVILCNLKPVKMRGVTSEAMVMCASTPEKVEILSPPSGAKPGDLIQVEGYARNSDPVLNPKKKIFETVAPDLKTNDSNQATYKGIPLTVSNVSGFITSQTLANVNIK